MKEHLQNVYDWLSAAIDNYTEMDQATLRRLVRAKRLLAQVIADCWNDEDVASIPTDCPF